MNPAQQESARQSLDDAENNRRDFPQIVAALMASGFESYLVDFRRNRAAYYLPDGDSVDFALAEPGPGVAADFDADALRAAIREAQNAAPGYTYKGFCSKAKRAGCAGYLVSFSGRRVIYFSRNADIHTEHFPDAAQPPGKQASVCAAGR